MNARELDEPTQRTTGRGRKARSHEAIIGATNQLLAEAGYSSLTIEGVAARARVGKATVYRWWPSKAALVIEALRANDSELPTQDTGDVRADLVDAVRRVVRMLSTSTEGAIIASLTADLVSDPVVAEMFRDQILRPRRSQVADVVSRAAERGELAPDVNIPLLLDACVGAVFYRLVVSGEPVTDNLAEQLVDMIIDGVSPRAAITPVQ
jgi:AcrR family transcriptional regulator